MSISSSESLPEYYNAAEHFLTRNVRNGAGHKSAYLHEGGALTFADTLSLAQRMASLLGDAGADQESRVALLLDDSPELVVGFWGALWAGAVAVPINTACSDDDVAYILSDSRARVLITTRARARSLGLRTIALVRRLICIDDAGPFTNELGTRVLSEAGGRTLFETLAGRSPVQSAATTHRDEPAFWLYTSGSTGRPKGVVHAHGDMVPCAEGYGRLTLGLTGSDISFSVANIPFAYGLGATLYMPMWVGASAVLCSASNAFDITAIVDKFRPTVFWGIPSVYAALLSAADLCGFDPSSLRLCISAAEMLPSSVFRAFHERFGREICEGIGTTELLHIFLSNRPGRCRPGSCGLPVPGYEVRVLDEQGQPAEPDQVGDLEVRGPSLMLNYWNRRDESQRAMFGGAMRTGDKYVVGADGFFRFVGRGDDLFKVNGQWVAPTEVEATLREHPAVEDCSVVLDRDQTENDLPVLVAYVKLREGQLASDALTNSLKKWAKARLLHFKAPRRLSFVDALPRTVTGKVDRKTLAREGRTRLAVSEDSYEREAIST